MRITKISVLALLGFVAGNNLYAQQKQDSLKNKETKIEGVNIQGQRNKKTETAILQELKKSNVQKQAIGAEEISRKGISNIEQGLTKVTGINRVEGKGIFVRGLEERYNYLLINNLGSPSNNPFQKIIALNQFPTDVVGKLNIYKTFNSNLYADFAGATFDVETINFDRPFTKVEFGIGVNTQNTFRKNFKISEGANTMKGYIGLNSEDRKLPEIVKNSKPSNYDFTTQQSIHDFKDSWNVDNVTSMPNTNISFTTAQRFNTKNSGKIGLLFSLNQSSSYEYREGMRNQFLAIQPNIVLNNELNRKQYVYELESSAILGLAFNNRKTKVNLNAIYLQNSANTIQDYTGYKNQEVSNNRFFRVNQQDISRFLDLQLTAEHKLGERHTFKAGASYVINNYSQPDRKIYDGEILANEDETRTSYGANNLIRQYLDVNGKFYASAFAEYSVKLGEKNDNNTYPWEIAVGYNGFADVRKTSYRFIYAQPDNTSLREVTINKDRPQEVFNQSILNGAFHYKEGSNENTYKNSLYQFVNAGYLNLNFKPSEQWDILLGARVENNMNISRYKKQSDVKITNDERNQYFVLPSLSVKYAHNNKHNFRLSASKTITRPILIEYMPIEYINPDNENIFGNPDLKNSENYNLDLKWEFYPSSKEMFAVNLFGKRIKNAIERSFTASGNSNGQTITFYNAKHADIFGVELEGILNLGKFSDALSAWSVGANATFMYSNVERSEEELTQEKPNGFQGELKKRKLQGAAPYTINADVKYEFRNAKNLPQTISLIYNVSGSKIYGVGTAGADHIYEKPFNQLDLIYNAQLTKNWNIKMGVMNILNQNYKLEMGDNSYYQVTAPTLIHTNYKRGTQFNLTVGYTF